MPRRPSYQDKAFAKHQERLIRQQAAQERGELGDPAEMARKRAERLARKPTTPAPAHCLICTRTAFWWSGNGWVCECCHGNPVRLLAAHEAAERRRLLGLQCLLPRCPEPRADPGGRWCPDHTRLETPYLRAQAGGFPRIVYDPARPHVGIASGEAGWVMWLARATAAELALLDAALGGAREVGKTVA